jgi:hypothetical protein
MEYKLTEEFMEYVDSLTHGSKVVVEAALTADQFQQVQGAMLSSNSDSSSSGMMPRGIQHPIKHPPNPFRPTPLSPFPMPTYVAPPTL